MGDTCSKTCEGDNEYKHHKSIQQSVAITYENGNFTLPSKMPFQKQSTYVKIQKAAFNFCQQNNIDLDFMPGITRVIAYRQQRMFLAAFNRLPQNQKQSFLQQVNRIPHDQIDLVSQNFYHNFVQQTQKKYSLAKFNKNHHAERIQFSIPKCISGMEFTVDEERKLYEMGKVVVEGGQVALVIMCAGSSSRFGNKDKFLEPTNLKQAPNLTILDFIFIRLTTSIQNKAIPIIITCNEINFKTIQNFFRQRNYYGLDRQKFRFMEVQCLPVLDLNGKYCIDEKYKLIKRPFGTGRTIIEIIKERSLLWLKDSGVKYIHFIGAENLLEIPFDSVMLGLMLEKEKKIMAKCVGTASQWEKLPRYVASKNKKILIKCNVFAQSKDWSELTSLISESALYSAYKFPIPTNSIIISLPYLQELVKDLYNDLYLSQNYHIIRRKEKMMSVSTNKIVTSQSLTFEDDIRDLLACCDDPGLFYVDRNKNYAPIFSKKDEYPLEGSVEHFQHKLTEQFKNCKQIHKYINKSAN